LKIDNPDTKPTATSGLDEESQPPGLEIFGSNSIVLENKEAMQAYYHDQIPPFDVKLIAATERGHGAIMEILGMEILNCGSGISVDDITTDESCTWIGVNVIPWHSQTYNNPQDADEGTPYELGSVTGAI
jgi:hypothetical protein